MRTAILKYVLTLIAVSSAVLSTPARAQVSPSDSLALVALYNATDGPNWRFNRGWLTEPVSEWTGVTLTRGENRRVETLHFGQGNNMSGPLPAALGSLTALKRLTLHNNDLTGSIEVLSGLRSLESLYLSDNDLTGTLSSLVGIPHLERIGLSRNSLTGPIPAAIGRLDSLRYLEVDGNALSGPIPAALGALSRLRFLYLDGNELAGSIPSELGALPKLESLSLGDNPLSGTIPEALGNLPSLRRLLISRTDLSGPIPPSLGNLSTLETLVLGDNDLSGPIPEVLGALPALEHLDLGGNNLSGPIPDALGNISTLDNLNLYDNELTGTLPDTLGSLPALFQLYVGENLISGPVPLSYLDLDLFSAYFGVGVCLPDDSRFEAWIGSISNTDLSWSEDKCLRALTVRNTDAHGGSGVVLGGVAVTISAEDEDWSEAGTTGPDGAVALSERAASYSGRVSVGLARDSLRRTYSSVRLGSLPDTSLVLPAYLHTLVREQLAALDTTDRFVLGYDTFGARHAVSYWNDDIPLWVSQQQRRDAALARLRVASEGLHELYDLSGPLSRETAAAAVETVLTVVVMRRAFAAVTKLSPGSSLFNELLARVSSEALDAIGEKLIEGIKPGLPPWAAEALDAAQDNVSREVATAAATGEGFDPRSVGRGFLESIAASSANAVGPPVIRSAYVALTQSDLDRAVARASAGHDEGVGTVGEGEAAVQAHLAELTVRVNDFVAASQETRRTTQNGVWSVLTDGSLIAGRLYPPLAVLGAAIKGGEILASIGLTGYGFTTLNLLAFSDAPRIVDLSFEPNAASALPPKVAALAGGTGERQAASDEFDGYLGALEALEDEVRESDRTAAEAAARNALDEDDVLRQAVASKTLALQAVAPEAQAVVGFVEALEAVQRAQTVLAVERSLFMAAAAEHFAPDAGGMGPLAVADTLGAVRARIGSALAEWAEAADVAEAAREGLTSPAFVVVTQHGLDAPVGAVLPGEPVHLTATVQNAGDEGTDVRVELEDTSDGELVVGDRFARYDLGALGPGESRVVTWTVVPRDTSASGVSVGSYRIVPTATGGRVQGARGWFDVVAGAGVPAEAEPDLEFSLAVWPNPSSGQVRVRYRVASGSEAQLAVYDALGREVAVLHDGPLVPGAHTHTWDAGGMAPGAYVVRLLAGGAVATRTLSIAR